MGNAANQQTIATPAELEGVGLHTGTQTHVRFLPAPPGTGIRFRRRDLERATEIPATVANVSSTDRGTTLGEGEGRVHTVEHLLAAVSALCIDNLIVETSGPEMPILDGSFRPFFETLKKAGIAVQDAPAQYLEVKAPVKSGANGGSSYVVVPADTYRISTTIEFAHPLIGRQFASFDVRPDTFESDLAGARTFGFMHEAEQLYSRGLAQGATLENAVILSETGLASGDLRWPDEFVRHKLGDVVGDLALVGKRIRAHIVADRPSHAGNVALAKALVEAEQRSTTQPIVDIRRIMQHLPHRYPMLLVDRIVEFEPGKRIVGIKNVTINEPFFQGHYPHHPVMPGVLLVESMAQVGGLLMMEAIVEDKVIYFMTLDNIKFRRPVTPGDQLRFEVEVIQIKKHTCRLRGVGTVDGQTVVEGEMMARIVDA